MKGYGEKRCLEMLYDEIKSRDIDYWILQPSKREGYMVMEIIFKPKEKKGT